MSPESLRILESRLQTSQTRTPPPTFQTRVTPLASSLICDQLRIYFKQPYVTLVLNSYLVRCLSASTSSNTSSVHNFVQSHSTLKFAFCNKFDIKFVFFHSFYLFMRFARSGYISVRTAFDILHDSRTRGDHNLRVLSMCNKTIVNYRFLKIGFFH